MNTGTDWFGDVSPSMESLPSVAVMGCWISIVACFFAPKSIQMTKVSGAGSELDNAPLQRAIGLLSQQIWCWGQDILRREGNWLLKVGFTKLTPPEERKDCASLYTLNLSNGRCIVLRGFGVFYGDRSLGGVFLPRFEFQPKYLVQATLESPPFSVTDLPELFPPTIKQRGDCLALTLGLLDWILSYEANILNHLGLEYRRQTIERWNDGKRPFFAAECLMVAWRDLWSEVAENFDAFC